MMDSFLIHSLRRTGRVFNSVEKWLVIALVLTLGGFALLQIILRNVFSTGIVWGDTLLRHIMLWVSLLGAARATAEGRHIRIEIFPMMLSPRGKRALGGFCNLVPAIVCAVLTWASWQFIMNERVDGYFAFSGVPFWWLETIFPVSFAVMGVRFGCRFMEDVCAVLEEREP